MKIYDTVCPRNCYSTCSLRVFVDEAANRITRIEANPVNEATPEGACLKGLSYVEREVSEERIITPLKRNDKGTGFRRISWEAALHEITAKMLHFRENYGPQSILYYSSSGTKGILNGVGSAFWRKFGGYTSTYGDLCWPAGLEATRLTFGQIKQNVPWDIENAGLIILWGKNTAETNVQQMRAIDIAVEKGARLIVIDPRRTLSATGAELLIQPRPGSDGALALAVAHLLIKNKQIDEVFIKNHVLGFEQYKEMVMGFTPGQASQITDVPVPFIEKVAEYISQSGPMTICAGFGMQRYTNSGQAMRAMMALNVITGNIGKTGTGWQFANLQSSIFDSVKDPFAFFPPEKPDGVARISISTARLGQDMLSQNDPPIKMAWVERGNPVTQNPETHTVLKAFRKLEFRVVVEQFFTDTAMEADIILPAKTLFEQSDIIGAYWHSYIQLKQKILEPPAEVKPETEIYRLLAQRLGFPDEEINAIIPGPADSDIDAYLERKLEPFPELSLEKLKKGPRLAPGTQTIAYDDFIFDTPSGKIELVSEEAQQRWNVHHLPVYEEPRESVRRESPESQKFPLYLMTPNTKNRIHSQFNNLKLINQFESEPKLDISAADALARGIKEGNKVKVFNERGSLELPCHIDFGLKSGCVSITNGWWISQGGAVNFLSLGRETDIGYGAAFHDNLVEVELHNNS